MVNLFINYYIDKNPERRSELMTCFIKNGLCKAIDKTFVIAANKEEITGKALVWVYKDRRPTFGDFFKLINSVSGEDDLNIIANTDIYFDEANIELIKNNIQPDECYTLARWDIYFDGKPHHFNRRDTNDVWAFKGRIRDIPDCDFTLGLPGCDNAICERIQRAGYVVKNPSMDVKTYHLHLSGVRNYDRKVVVPKPYLLITPHSLIENNIVYARID